MKLGGNPDNHGNDLVEVCIHILNTWKQCEHCFHPITTPNLWQRNKADTDCTEVFIHTFSPSPHSVCVPQFSLWHHRRFWEFYFSDHKNPLTHRATRPSLKVRGWEMSTTQSEVVFCLHTASGEGRCVRVCRIAADFAFILAPTRRNLAGKKIHSSKYTVSFIIKMKRCCDVCLTSCLC